MIPFARILKYGNELPLSDNIRDFFVDTSNAMPTVLMIKENGEVWGNTNFGQYIGISSNTACWGRPYFVMDNVKSMFPNTWGTILITKDNKVMVTGRQQSFNSSTTEYWKTFQDMSYLYTNQGIDISNIKKMVTNTNTLFLLLNNGDVYAHGTNTGGVMGVGNTTPNYAPTKVWSGANDIWLTNSNAIVKVGSKTFYATGTNSYRQMGVADTAATFPTWTQIFKEGTDDVMLEYNTLRVSETHFILYGKGTTFYAQGRNYTSAWGVSGPSVDGQYTSYKGTLLFTPGDLEFFYSGNNQAYWTNLIIDNTGKLYIAGTMNGGSGSNAYTFQQLAIANDNAGNYKCGTSTRFYSIMDCKNTNFMWARGSSSTGSMGFTPLSTPLKQVWTHITDFVFNK